jgi:hypothetical protein
MMVIAPRMSPLAIITGVSPTGTHLTSAVSSASRSLVTPTIRRTCTWHMEQSVSASQKLLPQDLHQLAVDHPLVRISHRRDAIGPDGFVLTHGRGLTSARSRCQNSGSVWIQLLQRFANVLHEKHQMKLVSGARHKFWNEVLIELPGLRCLAMDEQAPTTDL